MKSYRFYYHSKYGWDRHWIEAESFEEAEQKVHAVCKMCGWEFDEGSLKECKSPTAAYIDALFNQHAMSFVSQHDD